MSPFAADHIVLRSPDNVEAGIVNPAVSSTAFLTSNRAPGDCLGNGQHCLQILGKVPAGVKQS